MKLLFMGTPEFAAISLQTLINEKYDISAVVCQPDKPKGRGYELAMPPVKEVALENKIEVLQPKTLKGGLFLEDLKRINPDVIIVVAYGKILPKYVLDYPKHGCINVHGSLLPKLRGASPIQRSIVTGETITGVTTMYMKEGIDTGDMLLSDQIQIDINDTASTLHDKLAVLGGEVLIKTLKALEKGELIPVPQQEDMATHAPIIKKEMAKINWNEDANTINNLVRGMYSWPIAYTTYNGQNVKVIKCEAIIDNSAKEKGMVCEIIKGIGIEVSCGNGYIIIKRFKFEGKREMAPDEYLAGDKIEIGSFFI